MGGSVNIGMRSEGEVFVYDGYTSQIGAIKDDGFIEHDKNNWFYQKLKSGDQPLCLNGYGLVFIDFDKKWIGSLQGYTSIESWNAPSISLSLSGNILTEDEKFLPHNQVKKIFERGYVSELGIWTEGEGFNTVPLTDFHISNCDELLAFVQKEIENDFSSGSKKKNYHLHSVQWTVPGWTIENFEETPQGHLAFFKKLFENGIDMEPYIQDWFNAFKDYFEEDVLVEINEENKDEHLSFQLFHDSIIHLMRENYEENIPSTSQKKNNKRL